MAFPTVESVTETAFATDTTTHNVSMPATVDSGDLLIILFTCHANPTITNPAGWTELYNNNASTFGSGSAHAKKAAGTEGGGTVDVATSVAEAGTAHAYRITGWSGTISDVEASVAVDDTASNNAPNPPSHTPTGGAKDYLWIATSQSADDDQAITGTPVNYTDTIDTACGRGANNSGRTGSARRELNAASEDPAAFTLETNEVWIAATISVPPSTTSEDIFIQQMPIVIKKVTVVGY